MRFAGNVNRRPKQFADRRGALMIIALACLLISLSLISSMIQGALRDRRTLRTLRDQRQTEWLVNSAVERAAHRLASEPDYRGEIWRPSVADGKLAAAGEVVIEATREADDDPWQVRIVAEFPAGAVQSIRQSQTFEVQSANSSQAIEIED